MNQNFDFSKEFGEIDEKLVAEAGKEWKGSKFPDIRLYSRRIAAAAAVLLLCLVLAGNEQVRAAVREFTTRIGELFSFSRDLDPYAEILDQTRTQNGISVTLKEVILDDHKLLVSLEADFGDRKKSPQMWINEEKTTINGQHYTSRESISGGAMNLEAIEKYGMDPGIVLEKGYEDLNLPAGETKVHLVVTAGKKAPLPGETVESEAEFAYDFTTDTPERLREQTRKQALDITIQGEEELVLKELSMNDLYGRIVAAGVTWDDPWVNEYEFKIKGEDSLGNSVSFLENGFLSENELLFETSFEGDYDAVSIDMDDFQMSVPDKNCEYLDLQLYARRITWESEENQVELGDGDETFGEVRTELEEDQVKSADGDEYSGAVRTEPEEDQVESSDGDEHSGEIKNEPAEMYDPGADYGWEPVGEAFRINMQR